MKNINKKPPFDEIKEEVCSICDTLFDQDIDQDNDVCSECSDLIDECDVEYDQSEEDLNDSI